MVHHVHAATITVLLACLVDFHMPLLGLLQTLEPRIVVEILALGNTLEHRLDSRHHTLESTKVNVRTVVQLGKDLISILFNLILNVHLSTLGVLLFTRQSVVETKVFGVLFKGLLPLVIVKQSVAIGNTQKQPGLTLVGLGGGGVFSKETTDETTVGGDSGTSGNHYVVSVGLFFGHEHDLSGGSSHLDFGTRLRVAQKVGADSLLGRIVSLEVIIPVGGTADAKTSSLSSHVVTVTGRGDGVKTDRMGLAVLFTGTRGDYTPRLALPVGKVAIVVNDNVGSLTSGLGANDFLGGDNLSGKGSLVLVHVDRNSALVPVGLSFQEILGALDGSAVR